ncbi:MAG: SGNH/GDSL hydrolase family protein [Planctomycetota bacterium]
MAQRPTSITVLGDGRTGTCSEDILPWPARIGQMRGYADLPLVTDLSKAGLTTSDALALVQSKGAGLDADVVILQFGWSDAFVDLAQGETEPRIPRSTFSNNLRAMIRRLKDDRVHRLVVLMTSPPVRWTASLREKWGGPPYGMEDPRGLEHLLETYHAEMRSIAADLSLPLVDVHRILSRRDDVSGNAARDLLADGFYLNDVGHEAVFLLADRSICYSKEFVPGAHAQEIPTYSSSSLWAGRPDCDLPWVDLAHQLHRQERKGVTRWEKSDSGLGQPFQEPTGSTLARIRWSREPSGSEMIQWSSDEGASWSSFEFLHPVLHGIGHTMVSGEDGRIAIAFLDDNPTSSTWGDPVVWVGTWEDLVKRREGAYRIRLFDLGPEAEVGPISIGKQGVGHRIVVSMQAKRKPLAQPEQMKVLFSLAETDALRAVAQGD